MMKMNVIGNQIDHKGAQHLSGALGQNSTLLSLDISRECFSFSFLFLLTFFMT